MLIRKAAGLTQVELAARAGLSMEHIFRIEKGKSEPSINTTWRICQALDVSLQDLLNLTALPAGVGPFIRLPYSVKAPELIEQVANFNSDEMQRRYFQTDRFEDRVRLFLTFREVIASYEVQTGEYLKYGRAEYVAASAGQPGFQAIALSKGKLQLGEAFEAVRKIRAISALQLGRETGVAQSVISKFENNLSDLAISAYDRLVRRLGLTPDELIYIASPPRQRWPLFLAYGAYLNPYMVETNVETCLDFSRLSDVSQRAELMVGYRDWLAAEQRARALTGNQTAVETPPVFERLKLWLLTTPQSPGPGRLKLAN